LLTKDLHAERQHAKPEQRDRKLDLNFLSCTAIPENTHHAQQTTELSRAPCRCKKVDPHIRRLWKNERVAGEVVRTRVIRRDGSVDSISWCAGSISSWMPMHQGAAAVEIPSGAKQGAPVS